MPVSPKEPNQQRRQASHCSLLQKGKWPHDNYKLQGKKLNKILFERNAEIPAVKPIINNF